MIPDNLELIDPQTSLFTPAPSTTTTCVPATSSSSSSSSANGAATHTSCCTPNLLDCIVIVTQSVLLPHPPQSSSSSNYAFTRKTWIVGQILSFQASNKRVCKILLSGNRLSKAREQLTVSLRHVTLGNPCNSLYLSRLRLRSFVARCARKSVSSVTPRLLADSNPQPAPRPSTSLTYQRIRKSEPDLPNFC